MKLLAWVVLALLAWIAVGGVVAAAAAVSPFMPAGRMVDIGGRSLRLVCEGPARSDSPTVWMEAGAFGLAADWAAVQAGLAAKGLRSCAYDRAGLGFSDPGPKPRDSQAVVADLERLIAASGETGPFILAGHSMAGLHTRLFAARNPDKVAGLVLVEATTPEQIGASGASRFLRIFTGVSRVASVAGSLGLTKPLYGLGDGIGLPPQGKVEKRRAFVSGRHARIAAEEVEDWAASAAQARAAAPYDPRWPVAVVTTGEPSSPDSSRRVPERAAKAGFYEAVPGAGHATVLGLTHNAAVLRAVEFVIAHRAGTP